MTDTNDYGELNVTTPVDSAPPPRSDADVFAPDPWSAGSVGAQEGAMSHNSAGTNMLGGCDDSMDHNSQLINGDLAE